MDRIGISGSGARPVLLGELVEFPNSEFKDQVDAASRGYGYLITHTVDDDIGTTAGLVSG